MTSDNRDPESATIPLHLRNPDDMFVTIRLIELRNIRDRLRRFCPESNLISQLWSQVAFLYDRLVREAHEGKHPQPNSVDPQTPTETQP